MQNTNLDWFNEWKVQIIILWKILALIQEKMLAMLENNPWILEDINLCESFTHLQEMHFASNENLRLFQEEIQLLETEELNFVKTDLTDELDYIKDNVNLQMKYIINMENYIEIVDDNTMLPETMAERCQKYSENDISYLEQMKTNNEQLKKLKKERRTENE